MAAVRIVIPTALRQYAANHDAVDVEAESVEQALDDLVDRFDLLRRHLYADDGDLRNFVNVYVNEEDIRYLEKDATPLKEGDTISIVPSIAGGSFSLMDRLVARRKDILSPAEIKRYSRHLILPEVGMAGQLKLKHSSALIIGAGGLGVPLTQYLGAAGVGRLGIVDFDVIDETNLQRQVLYGTKDVGRKKIEVAKERVAQINPNVDVQTHETRLTSDNALDILRDYDVVIDGTDNFPTRYLVNDATVLLFDALRMTFRELKLRKNPECPICGTNPTIKELIDYEEFCGLRGPSEQVSEEFQISVEDLKEKIDEGEAVVLLDVREPMEWEIARLDRAILMPVAQVAARVNELSTADEMVVYCKTGARSGRITNFLRELGFRKVKNLVGGIDEWAEKIEPEMPRY